MLHAAHNGNSAEESAGRRNPIKQFAETGSVNILFPADHSDSRWRTFCKHGHNPPPNRLGRYGDVVVFNDLPEVTKTSEMAAYLNAAVSRADGTMEVCGSPGETANEPSLGRQFFMGGNSNSAQGSLNVDYPWSSYRNGMKITWLNANLEAPDQLRQRMAWALSQIYVVSSIGPGEPFAERWTVFYDIFVRNAFGNLRQILKEVMYSSLMAEFLTYLRNKGLAAAGNFPDENMAREMMQLFTIGLYELEPNGKPRLDSNGKRISTYSNDNVMSFARVWTGFDQQPWRSNIEYSHYGNWVDPMQMKPSWHDSNPKPGLNRTYIGDGFPLCSDLPAQSHLGPGATFKRLGSSSGLPTAFEAAGAGPWLTPSNSTSDLFDALCDADSVGTCTFPTEVQLDARIPCDGDECHVDTFDVIKLQHGSEVIFRSLSMISVHHGLNVIS